MVEISKQKFMNTLLEAGIQVSYEIGMPVAICENKDDMPGMLRRVKELAKKIDYNESLGVKCV